MLYYDIRVNSFTYDSVLVHVEFIFIMIIFYLILIKLKHGNFKSIKGEKKAKMYKNSNM